MSTNSTISVKIGNKIKSIYCHWDGYLSHNGKILLENYNSQEQAEKLIKLGDLSVLAPSPDKPEGHTYENPVEGYCIAYGRDRKEKNTKARTYKDIMEFEDKQEYNYYWDGNKWNVNDGSDKDFELLVVEEIKKDDDQKSIMALLEKIYDDADYIINSECTDNYKEIVIENAKEIMKASYDAIKILNRNRNEDKI